MGKVSGCCVEGQRAKGKELRAKRKEPATSKQQETPSVPVIKFG